MISTTIRSEHTAPRPLSCKLAHGRTLSRGLVYCFALFVVSTSSGGVILGFGSFSLRFLEASLLTADELNIVFNVGFQLLTFFTLLWSCLHDSVGPRAVATSGIALASLGNLLIALAVQARIRNVYVYAIAYGLVGGGGNGPFIAAFQFASLFDARGLRCSVLAAGFNLAGYFYLLLNLRQFPLEAFFYGIAVFTSLLFVGICRIYPDTPYMRGDTPSLTLWLSCRRGLSLQSGFAEVCSALQRAVPALRSLRYWGFCLTFGWGALVAQWTVGAVGSSLLFPDAPKGFLEWAEPLITNATFLISPFVGVLIDRKGFCVPGCVVLASAIVLICTLWIGGAVMQWPALGLICLLAASVYTIQFAYLTMAFPSEMYSGLLTVSIIVQEILGFIAWPVLAVWKPFGADPSVGNFILMLVPSACLFAWPLWLQRIDDRRLLEEEVVGNRTTDSHRRNDCVAASTTGPATARTPKCDLADVTCERASELMS